MHMQQHALKTLCGACLVLLAGTAQADLLAIHNGTIAMTTARNCSSISDASLLDRCHEGSGATFGRTLQEMDAEYNAGSSYAAETAEHSLAIAGGNATSAWVSAPADAASLPSLHQQAYSGTEYARAGAHVSLLQAYDWDGSGDAARTLSLNFDYTGTDITLLDDVIAADAANNRIDASYSQVRVWVFSLLGSEILVEDEFDNPLTAGACYFDISLTDCLSERPDFLLLGSAVLAASTGSSELNALLNFSLDASRTTFVWLESMAWGRFGSYFDGSHTLSASWDNVEGLNVLSDGARAVPEPASILLLGGGLLLILGRRRR